MSDWLKGGIGFAFTISVVMLVYSVCWCCWYVGDCVRERRVVTLYGLAGRATLFVWWPVGGLCCMVYIFMRACLRWGRHNGEVARR